MNNRQHKMTNGDGFAFNFGIFKQRLRKTYFMQVLT